MTTFPLEFWTNGMGFPTNTAPLARQVELDGWDGLAVADSQNLTGDTYIALAMAAAVTERILLAPGVTNPLTRHPAVAATAIATIQEESHGRAVMGIGRGDSSLAYIGLAPAPVPAFVHYLERLQGYLSGEDVPFEIGLDGQGNLESADALHLAAGPKASRLRWLRYGSQPKVPVHVVASGPRVIKSCARVADGLIFAVGTSTERIRWAIELARQSREDAGLDPSTLRLAALIPMAVNDDVTRAENLVAPTLGSYVRFSVMHGKVSGPATASAQEAMTNVHREYDMNTHARRGPQSDVLTPELIRDFSIAGPSSYCIERLKELIDLGLSKIVIHEGRPVNLKDEDDTGRRQSYESVLSDVIPALKSADR